MPHLELRNQIYRIAFRLNGQRFSRSLKTKSKQQAELALARVQDSLHRLELGLIEISPDDDLITTLLSGVASPLRQTMAIRMPKSVAHVLDAYFESILEGSIEPNSKSMIRTHIANLKRHIGSRKSVQQFGLIEVQGYVNSRSKEPGSAGG